MPQPRSCSVSGLTIVFWRNESTISCPSPVVGRQRTGFSSRPSHVCRPAPSLSSVQLSQEHPRLATQRQQLPRAMPQPQRHRRSPLAAAAAAALSSLLLLILAPSSAAAAAAGGEKPPLRSIYASGYGDYPPDLLSQARNSLPLVVAPFFLLHFPPRTTAQPRPPHQTTPPTPHHTTHRRA